MYAAKNGIGGRQLLVEAMQAYHEAKKKKEIEKAHKKEYAKGFKEGQIAEANYSKSEI